MKKIFDYLDVRTLKEARLVSSFWRSEGGKIVQKKSYLNCHRLQRLHSDSSSKAKFIMCCQDFLSCSGMAPIINSWSNPYVPGFQNTLKDIPGWAEKVRVFEFSNWRGEELQLKGLYEILVQLPNVKVLELDRLDLSEDRETWLLEKPDVRAGATDVKTKLEDFLIKL